MFKGTLFVKFTRLAEPSEVRRLFPPRQKKKTHWARKLWSIPNSSHWRRHFLPAWETVRQNRNWSCSNFLNTGKYELPWPRVYDGQVTDEVQPADPQLGRWWSPTHWTYGLRIIAQKTNKEKNLSIYLFIFLKCHHNFIFVHQDCLRPQV